MEYLHEGDSRTLSVKVFKRSCCSSNSHNELTNTHAVQTLVKRLQSVLKIAYPIAPIKSKLRRPIFSTKYKPGKVDATLTELVIT